MASNPEARDGILYPNFVQIKSEPIESQEDIKVEPPDVYNEYEEGLAQSEHINNVEIGNEDGSAQAENESCSIKKEKNDDLNHPAVENITIKIEPTCYSSDDDMNLASYLAVKYETLNIPKNQSIYPRKRKKKPKDDDDYEPRKKKKKVIELVKKTYTTKAKKKENCYSDNVTKRIEIVTIDEEERLIEFKELYQSRRHMRYFCEDCAVGFVMEEPYVMHMKSHGPHSGKYVCDICRCRARTEEQLYKHRLRHYRRYRCTVCHRIFKDKETVSSHIMSEHIHEAFVCPQCGKGFRRPAYLKKHVAQQHTKGQKHECPVCDRVFWHRSMYTLHVRRHNDEVRNPVEQIFICDHCSRQLKTKQALKRHLAVHERAQPVNCALCPAMFITKRGLRLHEINKHTDEKEVGTTKSATQLNRSSSACDHPVEQIFICDHCSRQLKTKQALKRHLAVHEIAQPVNCALCPAMFITKRGLRLHEINKHTDEKERRLLQACPHCERECTTPALLRQHIRRMHEDRTKKYQCDHCKRFYYSKGEVRAHIVWSHAPSRGKRALFCCGREFRTRTRLKSHIEIHHLNVERARIYKCDQCDKAFANKQVLNRHKKSHTNCTFPCPDCDMRFKCQAYVKVHHQLKHQHMTRAQIKEMKEARRASNLRAKKKLPDVKIWEKVLPNLSFQALPNQDEPEDLSMRSEVKEICFEKVLVKQEIDSDSEISVPLFDLAELKSGSLR